MSPAPSKKRNLRIPTWPEVCAWADQKRKTIAMVLAGVVGAASGVWFLAKPLISHEMGQDAAAAQNAAAIVSVTTQMNAWHDERVRGDEGKQNQIDAARKDLQAATTQISELATVQRETNVRVEGMLKRQDEQSARLENIYTLLLNRATAERTGAKPRAFVTAPATMGPPAPSEGQP
jgi:hypothetical protein